MSTVDWRRMAAASLCVAMAVLATTHTASASSSLPSIEWRRPSDLTTDFFARNTKPVLLLVHKTWCGSCARLWDELSRGQKEGGEELLKLANDFVMVNAADADEPTDGAYAPDGGYIPRIVFLTPNGTVQPGIKCSLNPTPSYQYFYSTIEQVTKSMEIARATLTEEHGTGKGDGGEKIQRF